jgi:serine/threonine protein kinase
MSMLNHPNIIQIYEVFENKDKIILVMEYASGGELYDHVSKNGCLPESEARRIFRQITSAALYCHKVCLQITCYYLTDGWKFIGIDLKSRTSLK